MGFLTVTALIVGAIIIIPILWYFSIWLLRIAWPLIIVAGIIWSIFANGLILTLVGVGFLGLLVAGLWLGSIILFGSFPIIGKAAFAVLASPFLLGVFLGELRIRRKIRNEILNEEKSNPNLLPPASAFEFACAQFHALSTFTLCASLIVGLLAYFGLPQFLPPLVVVFFGSGAVWLLSSVMDFMRSKRGSTRLNALNELVEKRFKDKIERAKKGRSNSDADREAG